MNEKSEPTLSRFWELRADGRFVEAIAVAEALEPALRQRYGQESEAAAALTAALPGMRERAIVELTRDTLGFVRIGRFTEAVELADRLLPLLHSTGRLRDARDFAGLVRVMPLMRAHAAWERRAKFKIVGVAQEG